VIIDGGNSHYEDTRRRTAAMSEQGIHFCGMGVSGGEEGARRGPAMMFGGAGGLHAGALIKDVGLASALVPRFPGINSALGCAIADMRHDIVQTINGLLSNLDMAELNRRMSEMARDGLHILEQSAVTFEAVECVFALDMSYVGQTHTVDVTLPLEFDSGGTGVTVDIVRRAFVERYRHVYGRPLDGIEEKVLNLRVSAFGRRPKFDLALLAPEAETTIDQARRRARNIWVDGAWMEAKVFDRLTLPVGACIPGPAILVQPDATVFIDPDLKGDVDRFGNLILTRRDQHSDHRDVAGKM